MLLSARSKALSCCLSRTLATSAMAAARGVAVVWYRNDLRVHDHDALAEAAKANGGRVVPVYCFDPRQVGPTARTRCGGFLKTGAPRARFLLDAVADLRKSLQALGSNLVVRVGRPEDVLPEIAQACGATEVYGHKEVCSEELSVERRVATALSVPLTLRWGAVTMCHLDDLEFGKGCSRLPSVFTQFRKIVESDVPVRPCTPSVTALSPLPAELKDASGALPTVAELCPGPTDGEVPDERSVLPFTGGETAGRARVDHYLWKSDLIATYKDTRNGLVGGDYSTKFSPWLAHGCVTARWIFHEIARYEAERTQNQSTYWVNFELLWRDYFRFVALQHGTLMFQIGGIQRKAQSWRNSPLEFEAWRTGQTGFPFVDANMRELAATGFMSNRGRQNVASFLTKDLLIDWRLGAEWFESMLVDHDVTSNYGNWNYAAGIGNDPRQGRHFNVIKQAKTYDDQAEFVHLWVPELRGMPAPHAHTPFTASPAVLAEYGVTLGKEYPPPIVASLDNGRLPLKGAAGAHAHRAHDKGKAFKGPGWMKEKEKRTGEASGEGESGSSARAARDRRGKSGRKGGRVQGAWA